MLTIKEKTQELTVTKWPFLNWILAFACLLIIVSMKYPYVSVDCTSNHTCLLINQHYFSKQIISIPQENISSLKLKTLMGDETKQDFYLTIHTNNWPDEVIKLKLNTPPTKQEMSNSFKAFAGQELRFNSRSNNYYIAVLILFSIFTIFYLKGHFIRMNIDQKTNKLSLQMINKFGLNNLKFTLSDISISLERAHLPGNEILNDERSPHQLVLTHDKDKIHLPFEYFLLDKWLLKPKVSLEELLHLIQSKLN